MLISVILPVYNVASYLPKCLESIINQSYKELEIICIDDMSEDDSYNVLKSYADMDSRIKIFKNSKNLGVGLTRNKGLKLAQGEYIHFVDPDDWVEDELYEKLSKKLNEFQNIDVLYFSYNIFDNENNVFIPQNFKNRTILNRILNPVNNPETFDNWDRYVWLKLHRKDFLLDNNIFFKDYTSLSDVEHAALVYTKCKTLVYTDIKGINYRIKRENSLVTKAHKSIKNIILSFKNNKELYKDLPENIKYKLLGFDYYQIRHNIEKAYINNEITTCELIKTVFELNTKDSKKYVYTDLASNEYELLINLRKVLMRKFCPNLWKKLIEIKKKLLNPV